MLCVRTKIKKSGTHGKGLFTLEYIKKGMIVGILAKDAKVMTEEENQKLEKEGDKIVIQTAVRWVGNYFLYSDVIENEDFINHSDNPSLLYHCGICFARRNIPIGEELTVDYRYFLAKKDVSSFRDKTSKLYVSGYSWKQALLKSAKELIVLLKDKKPKGK
ncbi:MAG: SET domain-containing protein [Nanoarchaeota archaeon]|nr:SET domain-containing protein [Nanoarchaeota archaeon]